MRLGAVTGVPTHLRPSCSCLAERQRGWSLALIPVPDNRAEAGCLSSVDQLWAQDIWLFTSLRWWYVNFIQLCCIPLHPNLVFICLFLCSQENLCLLWALMTTLNCGSAQTTLPLMWGWWCMLERYVPLGVCFIFNLIIIIQSYYLHFL